MLKQGINEIIKNGCINRAKEKKFNFDFAY